MLDKQLRAFHKRASVYERNFAKGRGFEAVGTLGRSASRPRRGFPVPVLQPLLVLVAAGLVLKAAILIHVGKDLYTQRLVALSSGDWVERLGAFFLQPDPVSEGVVRVVTQLF